MDLRVGIEELGQLDHGQVVVGETCGFLVGMNQDLVHVDARVVGTGLEHPISWI